jgi:uncharacterized protein YqeY
MSELKLKLSQAIKVAMKAQDKNTLTFARSLHAAIRKKEIDDRVDLQDADVEKLVVTLLKQRQDSFEQFQKGGREDLASQEKLEIEFLKTYLPPQLSEEEVLKIVDEAFIESQAKEPKDMGKVMKILMPKIQGKADGKWVGELVKKKLGQA